MNLLALHRGPRTRWALATLACLLAWSGHAQTPAEPPVSVPLDTAATLDEGLDAGAPDPARRASPREADAPATPRFDIDLQANTGELREFLLRHLELQRFRTLGDLDASELARLLSAAPEDLRGLLGTLGHFSPVIEIGLLPAAPATTTDTPDAPPSLGTVTVRVDAGPATRVATSEVFFKGDIATAPEAAEQRAEIQRSGRLALGLPFTQADWDRAKASALRELLARRYPAGRIENSLADIDAQQNNAHLYLELDSGPPVKVGEVRVEGSERYDPVMVERLVRLVGITPGSDYNLAQLQAAQRRLAESGYFDSVFVFVDPAADGAASPVVVQVRESLRQKVVIGVGASTDSGARLSLEHTHHRVPGIGWRALSKLQLERDEQRISTDWSAPVDRKGWRWITGAQMGRLLHNGLTTHSQRLRAGQSQETEALDRSYFLQYDRARVFNPDLASAARVPTDSSVSVNYAWTRRRFDDIVSPGAGYGLGVELGLGTTLRDTRRPYARTQARWLGLWPLDGLPGLMPRPALGEARPATGTTGRSGRLALRLQGGAIWAADDAPVPETQLFLAGGDTSVRGYGLRDIGVTQPDGAVLAGRYLAVASLEWLRPVWWSGERTAWESVVFLDGGAVANQIRQLRPRWGVGAGARYNSPVGPLQVDLAYGLDNKKLRLHLSVGFTF